MALACSQCNKSSSLAAIGAFGGRIVVIVTDDPRGLVYAALDRRAGFFPVALPGVLLLFFKLRFNASIRSTTGACRGCCTTVTFCPLDFCLMSFSTFSRYVS